MILSDDAGQFALDRHALCWVHAERLVHKLDTFTDRQHAAQQLVRALIWWFYADLKAYKRAPDRRRRHELRARFDRIFRRRTGFATLDRLLARLHANKEELLLVLERPEVPLHTNGSEDDIRCQVIAQDLRRDAPRSGPRLPRRRAIGCGGRCGRRDTSGSCGATSASGIACKPCRITAKPLPDGVGLLAVARLESPHSIRDRPG